MGNEMLDEKLRALEDEEARAREEWEEAWAEHHWKLLASAKTDEPFRANLHPDFKRVKELLNSKHRAYKRAQQQCQAYERLLA
jgi:DNA-binding HxlR family transcriptional regulator